MFAKRGAQLREAAVLAVAAIMSDPQIEVVPQTRRLFQNALAQRCHGGSANFFLGARLDQYREKVQYYRLIVACMLSGASRDRPEIVGWSTALRGQVINESLGQLPKKLAAGPRLLARTESSRSESGTKQGGPPHDHWAKLGQLRYTRSQYSFVAIALFARVY